MVDWQQPGFEARGARRTVQYVSDEQRRSQAACQSTRREASGFRPFLRHSSSTYYSVRLRTPVGIKYLRLHFVASLPCSARIQFDRRSSN